MLTDPEGGRSSREAPGGLLLAAGGGRRYGMPKALIERDGRLLVETALAALREGGCDPVVVVLGAGADPVRRRVDLTGTTVVVNPQWQQGMGCSLRIGLRALADTPARSALVMLVDLPGVTAGAIRRIGARHGPAALVVASYRGRQGHPVLLGRDHWAGVCELARGDTGARPYLRQHAARVEAVACDDVADGADIDEPGDWDAPRDR